MKRHASLIPLSQEHHQVLLLAQLYKNDVADYKGLPDTLAGKKAYGLELYNEKIKNHFYVEESTLFPFIINEVPGLKDLVATLEQQHRVIQQFFEEEIDNASLEDLDEIGQLIEKHTRTEERQLFAQLQEKCSEEKLNQLKLSHLVNKLK